MDSVSLEQAYATCRGIAKREAKNFYYAFVALPKPKRDAICAIYAFMRQADDLADDEHFSIEHRKKNLDAWLVGWRATCHSGDSADPVFLALYDAVNRYNISLDLLDKLVAGVTMDLKQPAHNGIYTYSTFDNLYDYCYLVASVVGLVTIRIFGYSDPRAEKLAEETGIAFQLTNILRDVAEDAERGRVYLPLEDLHQFHVPLDDLLKRQAGTAPTAQERALLAEIARRAEEYYRSAEALLPLIDRESRPALHVLVTIYHELLGRIEKAEYNVFAKRQRVSTARKLAILCGGLLRILWARLTPWSGKKRAPKS